MERVDKPYIIIDKDGWKDVIIEAEFNFPEEVKDASIYLDREKMMRYVNNHPERMYHYWIDNQAHTVDCKCSTYVIRKWMSRKGASEDDILIAQDISHQFSSFYGRITACTKKSFGGTWNEKGGILESRAHDLLDLFGKLHSVEEVTRIILQDWGIQVHKIAVQNFYTRNFKEIERLRDAYANDYSDVALTKKRSRLDKLSVMFYTYFQKWTKDSRLDYSKELRGILEQIRKEVEGEQININVNGQINVDLTIEANKTMTEAYKRIPVNNLILGLVAAKKGINPTNLMAQLTSSYYNTMTGYGKYDPETKLVHPVDLTYNWNEIANRHKGKDKRKMEDAVIITDSGSIENDAKMLNAKRKLLELLDQDKTENNKRHSK